MRFFDRKYLLQIGDYRTGDGLSIDDLQVQFKVTKSVNNKNKIDKCSISVYNLSSESLAFLETDYPVAVLSCGYGDSDDLVRLFFGEIIEVETRKQGTDLVTSLEISPYYSELTFSIMGELAPENVTVETVIETIRRQTSLVKGVYKGVNLKSKIVYGYPLSGTPRQMLNRVADDYDLQWKIEGEALFINDANSVESTSTETAPVISPQTGLIDRPYYFSGSDKKSKEDKNKKDGLKVTALINPNVVPGTIIKVESGDIQEFVRVEEVEFVGDFRGTNWYMNCVCSRRPEE